jgi:hypothetical protein
MGYKIKNNTELFAFIIPLIGFILYILSILSNISDKITSLILSFTLILTGIWGIKFNTMFMWTTKWIPVEEFQTGIYAKLFGIVCIVIGITIIVMLWL